MQNYKLSLIWTKCWGKKDAFLERFNRDACFFIRIPIIYLPDKGVVNSIMFFIGSIIYFLRFNDMSPLAQWYVFSGSMICLLWLNDMSSLVQGYVSLGSRIWLLGFKNIASLKLWLLSAALLSLVSTSAHYSRQVCSLQSASLPNQVILPFNSILPSWEQYTLFAI